MAEVPARLAAALSSRYTLEREVGARGMATVYLALDPKHHRKVTQAPEPVTVHREACPPALAEAIMRCLAKRPADRWQTADELVDLAGEGK